MTYAILNEAMMRLAISLCFLLVASGGPAFAKDCRIPDPAPGVRAQLPPECKSSVQAGRTGAGRQEALQANQGFIDIGNGTRVRIGGRVRVEAGAVR
ncbi:hypothetical protein BB934_25515 [Microvirga ossetica]|uniref:Uncharacterized protein n=2 Tax=Microvirga ossetica TaxID=1882682 RepID=A0A1B2EMG8_9HYPH|nr:hypothetical protein BB934_25515 [Microvirga ossetica]